MMGRAFVIKKNPGYELNNYASLCAHGECRSKRRDFKKKGTHLDLIPIFEFLIIAGLITNKNLVSFTGTFLWIQKHGDLKRRLTLRSEEIPNSYPGLNPEVHYCPLL